LPKVEKNNIPIEKEKKRKPFTTYHRHPIIIFLSQGRDVY
jgi:hypothetical protein